MQALILASGKGTHLRPLTVYTPKPIVPVVNRPLLLYQIEILKRAGIRDIILFLDYQPDKIEHLLGSNKELGVNLKYITEPRPLGTAGSFKFAADDFDETTVVFNGDILTDLIVAKALKQHKRSNALATVVLTPTQTLSNLDQVEIDSENRVLEFGKGSADPESNAKSRTNAGIYLLEPDVAKAIQADRPASFEEEIFPAFSKQKLSFFAYTMKNDYWCAIDSIENYLMIHRDFVSGKIRNFKNQDKFHYERATTAFIDSNSVIDNDCVIKANAQIKNSVLGRGVQVEENSIIKDSVIWSHSRISTSARIEGSILTRSCYVGKNVVVSNGSVLGDKVSLTDYTRV